MNKDSQILLIAANTMLVFFLGFVFVLEALGSGEVKLREPNMIVLSAEIVMVFVIVLLDVWLIKILMKKYL